MYCRDMLSEILHESQATGNGALLGNSPTDELLEAIDPRLVDFDSASTTV
jgi:hypothetical protein